LEISVKGLRSPGANAAYSQITRLRSAKIHASDITMDFASAPPTRLASVPVALLTASLVAGLTFPLVEHSVGPTVQIVAKGLGVGLLAAAALALASPQRGWLAAILAAGALGDVLLELQGLFFAGAGAFALGHCIAMVFYARNSRPEVRDIDRFAALALIGWGLAMPVLVSPAGTPVGALMLYSVLLCGMGAALMLSRFSRLAVAGALLFVVSDTLLIMRLGGRLVGDAGIHGLLIWFSYYIGQALIFFGVATGLVPPAK
jgi:uncharacterized membrane protein YhhN